MATSKITTGTALAPVTQTAPAAQAEFKTGIIKAQDMFLGMLEGQFLSHGMRMTEYQKTCAMNAIYAIQSVLDKTGVKLQDLDQTGLTGILKTVTALQLNASAMPREVYFTLRSEKRGESWIKKLEMGVEGDGNDALLRRFGVDVAKVGRPWLVREEDEFTFPMHKGLDVTPPEWIESGKGAVVRVVYPVALTDGTVEYLIQEREDVRANLMAHLTNNLMNETFGICKKRFDATDEQKKKIEAKKNELLASAKKLTMEQILDSEALQPYLSPAWTEPQSREAMIIRKMRNNAVKKYPKDFGSGLAAESYAETEETYKTMQGEVLERTASETLDMPFPEQGDPVEEPKLPAETKRNEEPQMELDAPGW